MDRYLIMYEYKSEPFDHQRKIFEDSKNKATYAILWEQGTGKTKVAIDTAAFLYQQGNIDAVFVLAPNGVHFNWQLQELPAHLPNRVADLSQSVAWSTAKSKTKRHGQAFQTLSRYEGLKWLFMSYNAVTTKAGKVAAQKFLDQNDCLFILDESHMIKTPNSKRTKTIMALADKARYKRILTGTPVDKPFDIYTQLAFLDKSIWRSRKIKSFWVFKQCFGVWKSRQDWLNEKGYDPGYDELITYKNLDLLADIVEENGSRVVKDDVLDLPRKLYTKHYFDLSRKQRQYYDELKQNLELELEDTYIDGTLAIVRLLRLQQITAGYLGQTDEPAKIIDPNDNPRLDATVQLVEGLNHSCIIWCRFTADIDQLCERLGKKAVRYDGTLNDEQSQENLKKFRDGEAEVFVANPMKGGTGITLNEAKTAIFYTNDFKLLNRLQAEDRCHRIGQDGHEHSDGHGVLYVDMCAVDTVDSHITEALRDKRDIASQITGDELKEWV